MSGLYTTFHRNQCWYFPPNYQKPPARQCAIHTPRPPQPPRPLISLDGAILLTSSSELRNPKPKHFALVMWQARGCGDLAAPCVNFSRSTKRGAGIGPGCWLPPPQKNSAGLPKWIRAFLEWNSSVRRRGTLQVLRLFLSAVSIHQGLSEVIHQDKGTRATFREWLERAEGRGGKHWPS